MAGLLILWLVMEIVCLKLWSSYVALFSDNSPTIGCVKLLAAKGSLIAMQLVWALTLRLKRDESSPLTPLHISGEETYMTDIPSCLFGSNLAWFCKNDTDLLNLFNKTSPLPNQASWTVFGPYNAASMKVISVMGMQHFEMGEWLQLKKAGKMLETLVFLCQAFGSGALTTGCHVPASSSVPHRLHSFCTLGSLWLRKTSCNCHSLWGALVCWHDGLFGLWRQSNKSSRQKI